MPVQLHLFPFFYFQPFIVSHSSSTSFMISRRWLLASKHSSSHVLILACVYLCSSLIIPVRSGTLPEGGPCSTANNRIDKLSHRFIDDCDDKTFCSGSVGGTCIPKRCRTDVFPFGYKDGDVPPPLCDLGSFCPDEGGGCTPLVGVGQPCQLNQDRQCAPPPNWQELASDWNFNGSLCLGSICSCVFFLSFLSPSSLFYSMVFLSGCEEDLRVSRLDSHARWIPRITSLPVQTDKNSSPRSSATTAEPRNFFATLYHTCANLQSLWVSNVATIKNASLCVPSPL